MAGGSAPDWARVVLWTTIAGLSAMALFLVLELFVPPATARGLTLLHLVRGLATAMAASIVAAIMVQRTLVRHSSLRAERFRFLDRLPVATFALDINGAPAYANDAALDLLGRGVIPSADPGRLSEVYPSYVAGTDDPYPPERMPIVRALQGEHATVDDVELFRNGRRVPIEATAAPVRDSNGDITHAIAVFFDISERRRAQEEALQRVRHEESARYEKRMATAQAEFVNHAAHQLATPLTPIRVAAGRLKQEVGNADVDVLQRNVERLNRLVKQVVAVAEVDSLRSQAPVREAALGAIVKQAAQDVDVTELSPLNVAFQCDDVRATAHGELLRRAVAGLIRNALEASGPEQPIHVTVTADPVRISVTDIGRGWDGDLDPTWMQPFQQGATDLQEGWGLGLYVANVAAQAHGGRLLATSPGAGKGATFTIEFGAEPPMLKAAQVEVA